MKQNGQPSNQCVFIGFLDLFCSQHGQSGLQVKSRHFSTLKPTRAMWSEENHVREPQINCYNSSSKTLQCRTESLVCQRITISEEPSLFVCFLPSKRFHYNTVRLLHMKRNFLESQLSWTLNFFMHFIAGKFWEIWLQRILQIKSCKICRTRLGNWFILDFKFPFLFKQMHATKW